MSLIINAAPGTGGGGGTPGGSDTELQYNNAGSFGGMTDINYFAGPLGGLFITGDNTLGWNTTVINGGVTFNQTGFLSAEKLESDITTQETVGTDVRDAVLQYTFDVEKIRVSGFFTSSDFPATDVGFEFEAKSDGMKYMRATQGAIGPVFTLDYNKPVQVANDIFGVVFNGRDNTGSDSLYGAILSTVISPTAGAEVGRTGIYSTISGVNTLGGYAQNGQWNVPGGTLSAPGLAWVTGGSTAGIRAAGVNDIRYVLAGTDRWGYISNQMRQYALGSAGLPSIVSAADPDTGMWVANGVVGFALNAVELARFATGGFIMNNRLQLEQGASIASANDITLGDGNDFEITGAVTINRIATANWQAGSVVTLELPSGITLADGVAAGGGFASIRVSNTGNLTTLGVTVVQLRYNGTTWDVLTINRLT